MNRQALRSPIGREERAVGNVRQSVKRARRHDRQGVHGLSTVVILEQVLAAAVESGVLLQVLSPGRHWYGRASQFVVFDRILVDGGVDQAQVVNNAARLRALTGTEESRHRDRSQEGDD